MRQDVVRIRCGRCGHVGMGNAGIVGVSMFDFKVVGEAGITTQSCCILDKDGVWYIVRFKKNGSVVVSVIAKSWTW